MPIAVNQTENKRVIRCEREVDIGCSGELKEALLRAISPGKKVHVDLSAATEIDVTAIQLLLAAAQHCEKIGARFALDAVSENIRAALREAGFENFPKLGSSEASSANPKPARAGDRQ